MTSYEFMVKSVVLGWSKPPIFLAWSYICLLLQEIDICFSQLYVAVTNIPDQNSLRRRFSPWSATSITLATSGRRCGRGKLLNPWETGSRERRVGGTRYNPQGHAHTSFLLSYSTCLHFLPSTLVLSNY